MRANEQKAAKTQRRKTIFHCQKAVLCWLIALSRQKIAFPQRRNLLLHWMMRTFQCMIVFFYWKIAMSHWKMGFSHHMIAVFCSKMLLLHWKIGIPFRKIGLLYRKMAFFHPKIGAVCWTTAAWCSTKSNGWLKEMQLHQQEIYQERKKCRARVGESELVVGQTTNGVSRKYIKRERNTGQWRMSTSWLLVRRPMTAWEQKENDNRKEVIVYISCLRHCYLCCSHPVETLAVSIFQKLAHFYVSIDYATNT